MDFQLRYPLDQPPSPFVPPPPISCITGLPVEVLGMIFDIVDAQTRADARMAHPLLARGVWHVENRLANECMKKGVAMPPKEFFSKAARAGAGVDYKMIKDYNIFGENLECLCERSDEIVITRSLLPPIRDEEGNTIRSGSCLKLPTQFLNLPRDMNCDACGKITMEFDLQKFGFNSKLLRTNMVRFSATLTGIQIESSGDIDVRSGLVKKGSYAKYVMLGGERENGPDIPTWGKEITIKLGTPTVYTSDGILDVLYLRITVKNNFALMSVDLRATINEELL